MQDVTKPLSSCRMTSAKYTAMLIIALPEPLASICSTALLASHWKSRQCLSKMMNIVKLTKDL